MALARATQRLEVSAAARGGIKMGVLLEAHLAQDTALPAQDTALLAQGTGPPAQGTALLAQDTALPAQGTALLAQHTTRLARCTALTARRTVLLARDTALAVQYTALPVCCCASPAMSSLAGRGTCPSAPKEAAIGLATLARLVTCLCTPTALTVAQLAQSGLNACIAGA